MPHFVQCRHYFASCPPPLLSQATAQLKGLDEEQQQEASEQYRRLAAITEMIHSKKSRDHNHSLLPHT